MMNFAIFHIDGSFTLMEQTKEQRTFLPIDSVSEGVNYLNECGIDVPINNVITETQAHGWREQLEALIAERSAA